jgi:hypothetical protein
MTMSPAPSSFATSRMVRAVSATGHGQTPRASIPRRPSAPGRCRRQLRGLFLVSLGEPLIGCRERRRRAHEEPKGRK